jgi:hypothetical protein
VRKLLAAFFLFVFAFNIGGYYLIFWGLQYHATRQIAQLVDTGTYTSADEITFQVAITLPYAAPQDEFTRANGSFEHDGEFYQVIKQKIAGDQLMIVCLKNHQKKTLTRALSDLTNVTHSLPGDAKQTLRILAKLFKDYQSSETPLLHTGSTWSLEIGLTHLIISSNPPGVEITGPPPRLS